MPLIDCLSFGSPRYSTLPAPEMSTASEFLALTTALPAPLTSTTASSLTSSSARYDPAPERSTFCRPTFPPTATLMAPDLDRARSREVEAKLVRLQAVGIERDGPGGVYPVDFPQADRHARRPARGTPREPVPDRAILGAFHDQRSAVDLGADSGQVRSRRFDRDAFRVTLDQRQLELAVDIDPMKACRWPGFLLQLGGQGPAAERQRGNRPERDWRRSTQQTQEGFHNPSFA